MLEADLDKVTPDDLKETATYTVTETHKITRTQTEEKLAAVLQVIHDRSYPNNALLNEITLPHMKMMTRLNKTVVLHRAAAAKNQAVMSWADLNTQDLTEVVAATTATAFS